MTYTALMAVLLLCLAGCGAGLEDPDPRPECYRVANQSQPVCKVGE